MREKPFGFRPFSPNQVRPPGNVLLFFGHSTERKVGKIMKEEQLSAFSNYLARLQERAVFGHDTMMHFDMQIALVFPRCTIEAHCHSLSLLRYYTDCSTACCALTSG